jgi:hypothetical protein
MLLIIEKQRREDHRVANETRGALPAADFIKPYQGAVQWSAFFRFKRAPGSASKEVKQVRTTPVRGAWMMAFHWTT